MRCDFRGVARAHVFRPGLGVLFFVFSIFNRHGKLRGIDIGEFGTVSVTTPDNPLLVVIVVGTRQEVTKRELRVPDTLLLMHPDGDTTQGTIVLHGYGTRLS